VREDHGRQPEAQIKKCDGIDKAALHAADRAIPTETKRPVARQTQEA
jgi:hypothetical protein